MEELRTLIFVIGALLITMYIIHGFWEGRQNRAPLVRDSRTENNAQSLEPITEELGEREGAVKIMGRQPENINNAETAAVQSQPSSVYVGSDAAGNNASDSIKSGFVLKIKSIIRI